MQMLSVGEAATLLGVAVSTLRRWETEGRLIPSYRTPGGHRHYALVLLQTLLDPIISTQKASERVICYARVSSHDQKQDLIYQSERCGNQWFFLFFIYEPQNSKYCSD
jgi:Predicted site-specific integrase-resolvase